MSYKKKVLLIGLLAIVGCLVAWGLGVHESAKVAYVRYRVMSLKGASEDVSGRLGRIPFVEVAKMPEGYRCRMRIVQSEGEYHIAGITYEWMITTNSASGVAQIKESAYGWGSAH